MSPDGGIHAREELVQNEIIDIYKNNAKIKTFASESKFWYPFWTFPWVDLSCRRHLFSECIWLIFITISLSTNWSKLETTSKWKVDV